MFFLNNNSTANIQDFISVLTRDIIPRSMQFPKYVFSLVKLGSETISSCKNLLNSSTNYLSAPILCNEEYLGELRIGYTDTDMPFIPEFEQNLINSYADGLGRIVEINKAKEIIKGKDLKYKEFIELAPEAIMLGDNSKSIYILFANEKTCELTGYSIEELSTLTFQQLFTTDSLNKIPFRWGQIENGETVISQRDLTRKNGEIILVETISKKLPDNSFCTFLRDISHIKKAASIEFERNEYKLKAELKEAQNELYAEKLKVQEQEQELLNRQIQDQKKQMDYFNLLLKNKIKQNEDLLDVVRKVQEKGIVKECDNCVRIIEKRIREDKIHVDNAKANASLKDSYVSQLLEKYPALTKNDLRLISKIRLGIPNKQIAVLLNINTSSVIVGRYRLRQKLKLSKEQGLDAFLNSM